MANARQEVATVAVTLSLVALFLLTTTLIGSRSEPGADDLADIAFAPVQADVSVQAVPAGPVKADPGWAAGIAGKTDIGSIAAAAYGTAALRLAAERPGCRIGWSTLAGIGSIETNHGTDRGTTLLADGTTSHPILGPALDGSSDMASIPSDGGTVSWHGDSQWDHAIGPMQFIPSTWKTWGADANGDGTADPNNIADAALTAGLYLCASGADLTTPSGWTRAVFSYNHSADYVRNVLNRANAYAKATS